MITELQTSKLYLCVEGVSNMNEQNANHCLMLSSFLLLNSSGTACQINALLFTSTVLQGCVMDKGMVLLLNVTSKLSTIHAILSFGSSFCRMYPLTNFLKYLFDGVSNRRATDVHVKENLIDFSYFAGLGMALYTFHSIDLTWNRTYSYNSLLLKHTVEQFEPIWSIPR